MSEILVWPRRGEFAGVVDSAIEARRRTSGTGRSLINISLQQPNTLLHDGHAWWRRGPSQVLAATRRALNEAAALRAGFLVHASWAFLQVDPAAAGGRLRPYMEAALEAEDIVLHSGRPAAVVRLGYLYGPEMRDMRAYRRAFRLRRPYWAGPRENLQHHLHTEDAARALVHAAATRREGTLSYATDGRPASFADFGDHFAGLVGNSHPLHLPWFTRPFVHLVVYSEHQEQTDLGMPGAPSPLLDGFTPTFRGYREGLAQVTGAWDRSAG